MAFNYSKLEGKIVEVFKTRAAFAKALGIAEETLSRKLNNKSLFTHEEMCKSCELLGIEVNEIPAYFFVVDSQFN